MVTGPPGVHLVGRRRECDVLDRVLEGARHSHGGVLAVYGEPGVGETALLDYVAEASTDFRVARTVGVEGESSRSKPRASIWARTLNNTDRSSSKPVSTVSPPFSSDRIEGKADRAVLRADLLSGSCRSRRCGHVIILQPDLVSRRRQDLVIVRATWLALLWGCVVTPG